jgi:hypothetical protein
VERVLANIDARSRRTKRRVSVTSRALVRDLDGNKIHFVSREEEEAAVANSN